MNVSSLEGGKAIEESHQIEYFHENGFPVLQICHFPTMYSAQRTKKQTVPGAGNGLFTTVAVGEGQEIFFLDHPLAYALDARRLQDTCANCLRKATEDGDFSTPEVKLRRCMGCKVVKYCGEVGEHIFLPSILMHPRSCTNGSIEDEATCVLDEYLPSRS